VVRDPAPGTRIRETFQGDISSVDAECVFSFVGVLVSKRRHRLGPLTIQATALLSAYSRAGLVELGCLAHARKAKTRQKEKEVAKQAVKEAEEPEEDTEEEDKEAEE
jgi:hypothetical protein